MVGGRFGTPEDLTPLHREATALGNLTLQARALGAIPHRRGSIRELVRANVELEVFAPGGTSEVRVR